jgi:iron-sulfur cluster repair protein YtfE (RIC family)
MTTTEFGAGNDVRALLLVHDGLRTAVPRVARQVRALRLGDRRAARALARSWATFSRGLARHRLREDEVLWPLVLAAAPELAGEVRRLRGERDGHDTDLALVACGLDRIGGLAGPEFDTARINVAATVTRLDIHLRRHLAAQEALVLPVLRHGIAPADWAILEAALATRPDHRPSPVRALHRLVCSPRYRHPAATR